MSTEDALVEAAIAARERAYAPYSKFMVGAAVETVDGLVFSGCNVENVTFGLTRCAEQVALVKAVSEGHRKFTRIAVVTATEPPAHPCGLCRQLMVEFADDLDIILVNLDGHRVHTSLSKIMPYAFRPSDLPQPRVLPKPEGDA